MIPKLNTNVSIEKNEAVIYLYNSETRYAVTLDNDIAYEALKLIDGESSLNDIANNLLEYYDVDDSTILNDISEFILRLEKESFLEISR